MPADGSWMGNLGVFLLLALIPFVVVVGTSFAKIAIVLGIVRNAFSAPGVPPISVITGIAVVMTFFIMAPVAEQMVQETRTAGIDLQADNDTGVFGKAILIYETASPPLLGFLKQNTPEDELATFEKLAGVTPGGTPEVRILLMAFASAELVEAILIGVLLLIPFLLVDLVCGHTLVALGMTNIPRLSVSLPLKLLLFIAADGWHLLVNALVQSYGT